MNKFIIICFFVSSFDVYSSNNCLLDDNKCINKSKHSFCKLLFFSFSFSFSFSKFCELFKYFIKLLAKSKYDILFNSLSKSISLNNGDKLQKPKLYIPLSFNSFIQFLFSFSSVDKKLFIIFIIFKPRKQLSINLLITFELLLLSVFDSLSNKLFT